MKIRKIEPPSVKIESNFLWYKRIWILIRNPFTYIFKGYVEW